MQKPWYKKSKFWMAIVSAGLIVANSGFGLGLSEKEILYVAGALIAYIIGEGIADSKNENTLR